MRLTLLAPILMAATLLITGCCPSLLLSLLKGALVAP